MYYKARALVSMLLKQRNEKILKTYQRVLVLHKVRELNENYYGKIDLIEDFIG